MRFNFVRVLVFSMAAMLLAAVRTMAGDGHCAHCGGSGPCQKVCRLVMEEKSVTITCWGCKCDEFCLPGPSKPGCQHCELACGTDSTCRECDALQAQPKRLVWTNWIPGSAKLHVKTKLMKKTVTKKVPTHRWVVEDLCSQCWQNQAAIAETNLDRLLNTGPNGDANEPNVRGN
jgi:hypothetical protein